MPSQKAQIHKPKHFNIRRDMDPIGLNPTLARAMQGPSRWDPLTLRVCNKKPDSKLVFCFSKRQMPSVKSYEELVYHSFTSVDRGQKTPGSEAKDSMAQSTASNSSLMFMLVPTCPSPTLQGNGKLQIMPHVGVLSHTQGLLSLRNPTFIILHSK